MTNHQPKFKQLMFRENPEEMTKVHLLSKALWKVKMGKKRIWPERGRVLPHYGKLAYTIP